MNLRLADALLHIGQEAIANAVSHADPTTLTITLSYRDSGVELVVKDNGQGFMYLPQTAGFGISGMQKRARDVGATLQILSAPGMGTQVHVVTTRQQNTLKKRLFAKLKDGLLGYFS